MKIQVKYLREEYIEKDAEALLAEFSDARGVKLGPPIPIEDIIEKHLKLRIEFDNLHHVLGIPQEGVESDILGAIWVDRREICIDQSLDPEERPHIEARYRFTLAHEGGGHWRLHRAYLTSDRSQASQFGGDGQPSVVCRSSQAKESIEWQADFYASCLLMPRGMVAEAWRERLGDTNPRILRYRNRIDLHGIEDPYLRDKLMEEGAYEEFVATENFVRPFAYQFEVSLTAMRIRLESLGLLHYRVPLNKYVADVAEELFV